jgi:TATA-binding protein-associated factor Taf7
MNKNYTDIIVSLYGLAEFMKTVQHKQHYSNHDRAAMKALSLEVIQQLQEKVIGFEENTATKDQV